MLQAEIRPTILEIPQEDIEESLDHIAPLVKTLHVDIEDGIFVFRKTNGILRLRGFHPSTKPFCNKEKQNKKNKICYYKLFQCS